MPTRSTIAAMLCWRRCGSTRPPRAMRQRLRSSRSAAMPGTISASCCSPRKNMPRRSQVTTSVLALEPDHLQALHNRANALVGTQVLRRGARSLRQGAGARRRTMSTRSTAAASSSASSNVTRRRWRAMIAALALTPDRLDIEINRGCDAASISIVSTKRWRVSNPVLDRDPDNVGALDQLRQRSDQAQAA